MDAKKSTRTRFRWRAFVSVMTGLSFVGLALSGIILFVSPVGRIANWTGWQLLGLSKHQWGGLHIWLSLLFLTVSVFHLALNWRAMVNYFRQRVGRQLGFRLEWALALLLCGAVVAGTVTETPPFSSLLSWNDAIKGRSEHCGVGGRGSGDGVLAAGGHSGQCTDHDSTTAREETTQVTHRRMGYGRMTLAEYCESMEKDLETSLERLKSAGYDVEAQTRVRDIANMTGRHPSDVAELLR